MNGDLVMLGTIHRDPQGSARLSAALAGLDWGLISVEVSPYALSFRRRQGPALLAEVERNLPLAASQAGLDLEAARQHPGLAWLRAYLNLPHEWTASQEQAARRGAPCVALDFSLVSRGLLAETDQLVSAANLAQVLASPAPASAGLERRRAADLLAGRGGWPRPPAPEPEREAGLARRLRRLLAAGGRRGRLPLAHVGGWQHLLAGQDPPTLADRLGVPVAQRILIWA
ncbi:MAG: hypothetical protein HY910_14745 [Desulfarculus sp.]|nr:hypothetical protein [Desulfarculus sp.]